ncbi:MAG: hypothetical protein MJ094_03105 [Saccharofermentans sp.]|nr:hypothetical protein [Saccharofermentans sp.]
MGKGQVAMWLAIIRQLILYVPLLVLMNYLFGMFGLVWAQIAGDIMTDIVSLSWFNSIIKKSEEAIKKGESL